MSNDKCQMTDDEVTDFIKERVDFMNQMCKDLSESYNLSHITAEFGGFWPLKDIDKTYEIKGGNSHFNINSFQQIGWPDPFPIQEKRGANAFSKPSISERYFKKYIADCKALNLSKLSKSSIYQAKDVVIDPNFPSEVMNLIYSQNRYTPEHSPLCVYIPSAEVLFKLVRACQGCKKLEDLWIYNPKYAKEFDL
jgi:hypothetical protein